MVYCKGAERQSRCVDSLHVIEDKRLSFEVMVVANRSGDGGSFYHFSPALILFRIPGKTDLPTAAIAVLQKALVTAFYS